MTSQKWTKQGARSRASRNKLLQKIMRDNSWVCTIIQRADGQMNELGYNRIRTYLTLRDSVSGKNGVGWDARQCWKTPEEDYDSVVGAIDDLLPPDDVDLFPEGKSQNVTLV